jgi:hypothetical protein
MLTAMPGDMSLGNYSQSYQDPFANLGLSTANPLDRYYESNFTSSGTDAYFGDTNKPSTWGDLSSFGSYSALPNYGTASNPASGLGVQDTASAGAIEDIAKQMKFMTDTVQADAQSFWTGINTAIPSIGIGLIGLVVIGGSLYLFHSK